MTHWKKLIAEKKLFSDVEFKENTATLKLVDIYAKPEFIAKVANAISNIDLNSKEFQRLFRKPKKMKPLVLEFKPNQHLTLASQVIDALSLCALSKKDRAAAKAKAALDAKAQAEAQAKAELEAKTKADLAAKAAKKAKSTKEIRIALVEGKLFTEVQLKGSALHFDIHPDFSGRANQRVINQVLATLRRSSRDLQQAVYDIRNLNRKPFLGLQKNHGYVDGKSLLNVIVAAAQPTSIAPVQEVVAPAQEAVVTPAQEIVAPLQKAVVAPAQEMIAPVQTVNTPTLEDEDFWDFAAELRPQDLNSVSVYHRDNSSESLFGGFECDKDLDTLFDRQTKNVLFEYQSLADGELGFLDRFLPTLEGEGFSYDAEDLLGLKL